MKGHFYKPHCKCPKDKNKKVRCKCDAKWAFIIPNGKNPTTGKPKQIKRGGFDTKSDAQDAAAILLAQLKEGTFVKESNIIFKDFKDEWIKYYANRKKKVKKGTIRIRKNEIGLLSPYFDYLKMKEVTSDMYQDALNKLKEIEYKPGKKYADNTIDGAHRTGRMIFRFALEKGVIKSDPTEFAYVPRDQETVEELEQKEEEIKYLEKQELSKFLKAAKIMSHKHFTVFMILAYTGIRVGELCALKWKDVDFKERRISINKTLYNPNNNTFNYELVTPKTTSSIRTIEIDDDDLIQVLEAHKAAQNILKMERRDIYHDEDFVITKTKRNYGYPENIRQIENWTDSILKIAELSEDITPHSFRHTHTSLLAEIGIPLQDIMDRLGHKDDKTTRFVYLHVTKERKKEASQKFGELMRSL